jgi:uncharacterized protein (DUF58 family)
LKFQGKHLKEIYLHDRLLYVCIGNVGVFILGFPYPIFLGIGQLIFFATLILLFAELLLLFRLEKPFEGKRRMEDKLSNGDFNPVIVTLRNLYPFQVNITVIEEFPLQLQMRDKQFEFLNLPPDSVKEFDYEIRPVQRGVYGFGQLHIFVSTRISFLKRRVSLPLETEVKVYPSFIQARKYSFLAINNRIEEVGVKKIRKLGANQEFEQIREYVQGDDFRVINWKASARRSTLMVNQYQEEKAQNVYCIIDKGRAMHMPFEGLSLMDYSINASLVLSGIAVSRGDKAGLVTFSDKIGTFMIAESKRSQMSRIADALYDQETRQRETDFFRLYKNIKLKLKKRSLLLLFTNFDSPVSLHRQLKFLRALSRDHLLCTVVFDNTEINQRANQRAFQVQSAYDQTIAEKFQYEKRQIVKELNKQGIYTLLTEPQHLTIGAINKYIELKARGAL